MLALTAEPAMFLEEALGLAPGEGTRVLLWMHALIVGVAQMTSPSPLQAGVLAEDPALAPFRIEFRSELDAALRALFAGALRE
jgi:hypothetical protein